MVQDFVRTLRLTNEDVITTSGLCKHLNEYDHAYVTGLEGIVCNVDIYSHGDSLTYSQSSRPFIGKFKTEPEKDTWYFWNGTQYEKCEDQSNAAHPKSPR